MKISLERLLVESSKLQDHRQQSCVIPSGSIVFLVVVVVKLYVKKSRALNETPSQSYWMSLAVWDRTVLPATRHK